MGKGINLVVNNVISKSSSGEHSNLSGQSNFGNTFKDEGIKQAIRKCKNDKCLSPDHYSYSSKNSRQ